MKDWVDGWLFLPEQEPWTLDSPAALLESDDYEEADEVFDNPELARKEGLRVALLAADVQDIISNARMQKRDVSLDEIFAAFLFYFKFDAFMDLSSHA